MKIESKECPAVFDCNDNDLDIVKSIVSNYKISNDINLPALRDNVVEDEDGRRRA